ncbi:hypothetical protein JCM5296_003429 [Sporobolomyces johnsonii]
MDPTQRAAQAAFSQLGFFLLSGLPKGSEFGMDGQLWTVDDFAGVKLIPPGLHLFVFSAAPRPLLPPTSSSSSSADPSPSTASGGDSGASTAAALGVRHGILRFYSGRQRETIIEAWDPAREELAAPPSPSPTKRRRTVAPSSSSGEEEAGEATVVSDEYLQTLDPHLAPYPAPASDQVRRWSALSGMITRGTVVRVVGVDGKGCGRVDALMESAQEGEELGRARGEEGGRRFWGKKRDEVVEEVVEVEEEVEGEGEGRRKEEDEGEGESRLEFVRFDARRSWPPGAVGEELSRWSKDKSWLLSEVVRTQLGGDPKELLAELQLSFVLCSLLHNFSSLSSYKSLFALLCRSSLLALPSSSRPPLPSLPSPLLDSDVTLPLFASFLSLFLAQLEFLDPDFFATQLPALETHLVAELEHLRVALSDASAAWQSLAQPALASTSPLPSSSSAGPAAVWRTLVARWNALAATAMEKFGWDLGLIEGTKARYFELRQAKPKKREAGALGSEWEDEEEEGDGGGIPFEELEEGEDAPVIVDLEEGVRGVY